jgi:type VI secretion system protein ImpA
LLRPPFGENYRPADAFRFEEFSGAPEGYLCGGGGIACAGLLAQCFIKSGWGFQQGQSLSLDGMPMHTYRDAADEPVAVTAEVRFTSSIGEVLAARGFMPLLGVRGRDAVELAAIRPMYQETKILAGRWEGGQGGGGSTGVGLGGSSVGMVSKGQSGRPAPKREGPAAVTAEPPAASRRAAPSNDPEVDDDLAALLAGDDSPPQEAPTDETPADDSAAPQEEAPPELDPELAALLGDSGGAPTEAPPEELDPELAALLGDSPPPAAAPAEEALDPELAALLGEAPPSDSPAEPPAEESLDPELAALLGGGDSSPAEEPAPAPAEEALDPELAALLGGGDAGAAPEPDAEPMPEPAPSEEALDPDLAALLGGDANTAPEPPLETALEPEAESDAALDPDLAALLGDPSGEIGEAPAAPPPAEEIIDPDLAALLGESAPEASPEPEELRHMDVSAMSEQEPEPEPESSPPEPSLPAMATATEDQTDFEPAEESPASAQYGSVMQDLDELLAQSQAATNFTGPNAGGPPLIDFKSLLAPISDDEPAGGGVPYDVRERLEQMRKEVNPEAFAPDDPLRPTDVVKADWSGIIELAQETLRSTSKNLLVAARLVEALTKKHGFVGLRDGFHLMRLLVEVCWDRLDPPLEDEDMEVRAAPFNWLDDPDRGAYFPNSIRAVTLLAAEGNSFTWQQWQQSQSGSEGSDKVERIVLAAPRERCQAVVDALNQTQLELKQLLSYLGEKMGSEAPGLSAVRPAVIDCFKLASQILQRKGPAGGPAGEGAAEGLVAEGGGTVAVARPRFGTRDDIYQELANAATALERLEPHSPVPFLVRRAVELGALPFPLLMQALIRDANVLSEMNRELGIKSGAIGNGSDGGMSGM